MRRWGGARGDVCNNCNCRARTRNKHMDTSWCGNEYCGQLPASPPVAGPVEQSTDSSSQLPNEWPFGTSCRSLPPPLWMLPVLHVRWLWQHVPGWPAGLPARPMYLCTLRNDMHMMFNAVAGTCWREYPFWNYTCLHCESKPLQVWLTSTVVDFS